jgi:hypothetical protein
MIIYNILFYVLVMIASFFIWKKSDDKRFLGFFIVASMGLALFVWKYIFTNVIFFPYQIYLINFYSVRILRIILSLVVIYLMFIYKNKEYNEKLE